MERDHATPLATYRAANAWAVYTNRLGRFLRFGWNRPDADNRIR
jgi:hypothetical protein